ncbi:MAG: STAS domain-containing protein [Chloroflexi bacterium]|nr:STAS domain-containing protein [Chloroflexota bacterium]
MWSRRIEMNITVTQAQGNVLVTIIKPEGRINLGNTDELFQKAKASYEQGARDMIIDLSAVESMSSAGLRTLLSIAKMLNREPDESTKTAKARHFKIAGPRPELKNVLDIAGFFRTGGNPRSSERCHCFFLTGMDAMPVTDKLCAMKRYAGVFREQVLPRRHATLPDSMTGDWRRAHNQNPPSGGFAGCTME